MSFFGKVDSNSLVGSLNLDTTVPPLADPSTKRKSVFEPNSTTENRFKSSMFGLAGGGVNNNNDTNNPTATQSTTNFSFGRPPPATTAASAGGGIFGTTTATAGTGGFGLFGKPTAPTAATGITSSPSGPSLFNPTPTAPQPTKPSLFPQAGATTGAPLGGLFGQPATQPLGAQGTGLFNQSTNPAQGAAAFPNAAPSQTLPQQTDAQAQNRESAYFNGLLERQKKKVRFNDAAQDGGLGQLPSMTMDLGDLARRAQDLGHKSQKLGQSAGRDSRAHYLLSASGVTPGQAYREFQKLDNDAPPLATSTRIDFAEEGSAYLKGMQAKGREAMLRESMDRVYRDVDNFIEESLGIDFDEQKVRIMQHFGLMPRDENADPNANATSFDQSKSRSKNRSNRRSVFSTSGLNRSIIGNAASSSGSSSFSGGHAASLPTSLNKGQTMRDLRDKERVFMRKVEHLNRARLDEERYKVLHEFKSVETLVPGDVPKQLIDAYTALEEITKEQASDRGLRERLFADAHAQGNDTNNVISLRKQILEGSRTYLEKACYQEMQDLVQKNLKDAQQGGEPTILNKVRAYIRVRHVRHDLAPDDAVLDKIGESNDFCWVIVFYLLRSGHLREAVDYVNGDPAFQSLDRRFVSYLTSYANHSDRRLGRKLQEMISGEYQQRTKTAPKGSVDPYRIACLKIVGRCDLNQRNLESIGQAVEDWIWLQFALARESDALEDHSGEPFGLEQIVETVSEIGQKHFQKGQSDSVNSYGTYFLMQILAGMFEHAVDYLHSFNPVSATHAAIALDYYGLLRVSDFNTAGDELLTRSTTGKPQINFVPLIAFYTTTFRAALPVQAADYLSLLCLNSDLGKPLGEIFTAACHESLRELCLETREFAALLGDIKNDGSRIPGAIERRARIIHLDSHEQFLRFITSQAAAIADSRGQTADAALLYHLCDDYENVTTVLNRALADAIAVELGEEPISLQPLQPRTTSSASDTASQASQQNSSLSLTQSTSSPLELARNMTALYDSNASYFSRINRQTRETCRVLMAMLSARAKIEHPTQPNYLLGLEELMSIGPILPLDTRGEIPRIRQMATSFSALPQLIARCAGLVILWCVQAINEQRQLIAREGSWEVPGATEDDINQLKSQLTQMTKDLMVFAGLVRYKLPGRVYEMLTRAGGDVGGY